MFEPELSSDLEFMLQSSQVSMEPLAEALVETYYGPLYRLALAHLENRTLAQHAALQTLIQALLNRYRYQAGKDVSIWIYGLALQVIQQLSDPSQPPAKVNRRQLHPGPLPSKPRNKVEAAIFQAVDWLGTQDRQLMVLRFGLGWQLADLSALMERPEEDLRRQLAGATDLLNKGLAVKLGEEGVPDRSRLESLLAEALSARWPEPRLSLKEQAPLVQAVLEEVEGSSRRVERSASFQEFGWILLGILLFTSIWWGANRLFPEPTPVPVVQRPERTPTPRPTSTPFPTAYLHPYPPFPENVFYQVQEGDTVVGIARDLGITPSELAWLNRIPKGVPLRPNQSLLIPGRVEALPPLDPTPVNPPPELPPLTIDTPLEEILDRMARTIRSFDTLWFDAQITYFGPLAYRGPGQAYRLQVWASDAQGLFLAGRLGEPPSRILMFNEGFGAYVANPAERQPWLVPIEEPDNSTFPFFQLVKSTYGSYREEEPVDLEVVRQEEVAGREALVLQGRYPAAGETLLSWIDAQTGFPLRQRVFRANSGKSEPDGFNLTAANLVFESSLSSIEYNAAFPSELFDPLLPWRGGYASGPAGLPTISDGLDNPRSFSHRLRYLPPVYASPNFNPARSQLSFQWDSTFNLFSPPTDRLLYPIDLYASGFYLGRMPFIDPIFAICDRSPDGQWLAFATRSTFSDFSYYSVHPAELFWLNLNRFGRPQRSDPPVEAYDFAFSPDSRSLAFFGRPNLSAGNGVYTIDLETGRLQKLIDLMEAYSLTWSPDGTQLALISRYQTAVRPTRPTLIVIDVETHGIVYMNTYGLLDHLSGETPAVESAVQPPDITAWDPAFPKEMGDLDDCAAPPTLP